MFGKNGFEVFWLKFYRALGTLSVCDARLGVINIPVKVPLKVQQYGTPFKELALNL